MLFDTSTKRVNLVTNDTFLWYCPNHVVVPRSDGAGEVIRIGAHVLSFAIGDKVILQYYLGFYNGLAPLDY